MNGSTRDRERPDSEVCAIDLLSGILGGVVRDDVIRGIGDDCAVLSFSDEFDILMTIDSVARDVHFDLDWQSPHGVGWRALASSVSDIAAMGGEPIAAVVAIVAEGGWDRSLPGIYGGMKDLAGRLGVDIVGGDVTRTASGLSLSLTVLGRVEVGRAIYRDGARFEDEIWVTGTLGGGEAVRRMAKAGTRGQMWENAFEAYERIVPRIEEARFLVDRVSPTSMIDISDGLSTDLHHICRMSGVGAEVELDSLPVDDTAKSVCIESGKDPVPLALHGGEEFEICFTSRRGRVEGIADEFSKRFDISLSRIGSIVRSGMMVLDREGNRSELVPGGYDHLKGEEGRK